MAIGFGKVDDHGDEKSVDIRINGKVVGDIWFHGYWQAQFREGYMSIDDTDAFSWQCDAEGDGLEHVKAFIRQRFAEGRISLWKFQDEWRQE